jgi:hypothetical protein
LGEGGDVVSYVNLSGETVGVAGGGVLVRGRPAESTVIVVTRPAGLVVVHVGVGVAVKARVQV